MGVLEAIGGFFSGVAGTVGDLAGKAWSAIKSVYLFAAGVFDFVGGAWDWMVNGLGWLGDNLIGGLARLLHLLEWLVLHAIPEGLQWAIASAIRWAKERLHSAVSWLEGLIHTLGKWALGQIRRVWHELTSSIRHVWQTLTRAWDFIETVGRRAVDLVLHPEKLVKWILAALVLPLLRYLLERSSSVIAWLFRSFRGEAVAFAHVLEDVLSKVI